MKIKLNSKKSLILFLIFLITIVQISTKLNHIREPKRSNRLATKEFFSKTSKDNRSKANKALAAFVCGIILFILSIHFICWNERRAVKDTEFLDYIRQQRRCISLGESQFTGKIESDKVYLIQGNPIVKSEASIPGLQLNFQSKYGKIVVIKTEFNKFIKTITVEQSDKEGEEEHLINEKQTVHHNWVDYGISSPDSKFNSKFYHGDVVLSSSNSKEYNFAFPMINLNKEVEYNQTNIYQDNNYIYIPRNEDIPVLSDYFNTENNNISNPYRIIIRAPYVYILRNNTNATEDTFDPDTYEFTEADIRMAIKYYYIPEDKSSFTAIGGLKTKSDNELEIIPFKTHITKAGCGYFCCCNDSDDYYEVDLLYTRSMSREDVVKKLELDNTNCTWISRLVGFLMHFGGYYLILYPLTLLIGMIPFIGAVGAMVIIFFAFIFSMITYLFIVACAWICARPVYAGLIFGMIFILMFVGKISRDQIQMMQGNDNGNLNGGKNGYYNFRIGKFL